VECENRGGEVWGYFPFLRARQLGVETVVKVEPFIGSIGFSEIVIVLNGLSRISTEDVYEN
jgi:hypothetical protein